MTSPPFHAGDFLWCAFPESEYPARPNPHLPIGYALAVTGSTSATAVLPPGFAYQAVIAYTTSQSWRHAAGRPGVIPFPARQAQELGQQRAFVLHLWRVAYLPVAQIWFPRLSDADAGVVGECAGAPATAS